MRGCVDGRRRGRADFGDSGLEGSRAPGAFAGCCTAPPPRAHVGGPWGLGQLVCLAGWVVKLINSPTVGIRYPACLNRTSIGR
jgi:hypothetical protein